MIELSEEKKLMLGIEIMSGVGALYADFDMEKGRDMALMDTTVYRMDGVDVRKLNNKEFTRLSKIAEEEKALLHKRAKFLAGVTLEYINLLNDK